MSRAEGLMVDMGIHRFEVQGQDVNGRPAELGKLPASAEHRSQSLSWWDMIEPDLAPSWSLGFPPTINDIRVPSITDVRLTFYHRARYDPDLASAGFS